MLVRVITLALTPSVGNPLSSRDPLKRSCSTAPFIYSSRSSLIETSSNTKLNSSHFEYYTALFRISFAFAFSSSSVFVIVPFAPLPPVGSALPSFAATASSTSNITVSAIQYSTSSTTTSQQRQWTKLGYRLWKPYQHTLPGPLCQPTSPSSPSRTRRNPTPALLADASR